MRIHELLNEEFGVKTPSAEEVAQKHGVSLEMILMQLKKGTKVEKEHVHDDEMAKEIALDHLAELPDYYDRLEKMENPDNK